MEEAHEIQILAFMNFCCHASTSICFHVVCGCFQAAMTELRSCSRSGQEGWRSVDSSSLRGLPAPDPHRHMEKVFTAPYRGVCQPLTRITTWRRLQGHAHRALQYDALQGDRSTSGVHRFLTCLNFHSFLIISMFCFYFYNVEASIKLHTHRCLSHALPRGLLLPTGVTWSFRGSLLRNQGQTGPQAACGGGHSRPSCSRILCG